MNLRDNQLLDFAMKRLLAQNRVVFHQFQTVGGVFPILLGDISGRTGHSCFLVLGALHNDLEAIPF
jgi:hypothetical protein